METENHLRREARRGRQAQHELSLIEEYLTVERERLYDLFCKTNNEEPDFLYTIKAQADALANLEHWLTELINTGQLALTTLDQGD